MINWLKEFFHCHKWVNIKTVPLDITEYGKLVATGDRVYQQCKICGKMRKVDLV